MIATRGFSGIAPRHAPYALSDNQAQTALNVNLRNGVLAAALGGSLSHTIVGLPGTKKTIYKSVSGHWFSWLTDVDVVRSPIAAETTGRVYYTGDGAPKFTDTSLATGGTPYPLANYSMAVPAQASAPNVQVTGDGDDGAVAETRAYVSTNLRRYNGFDEESAPSPVAVVTYLSGQTVTLNTFTAPPSGTHNITHRRVYRTATGTQGTNYYYVGEMAIGTSSFVDSVANTALGEVMPSLYWATPPDALSGLVGLPNGILAGFVGKDVYFSDPWHPHAWPESYIQTVSYDIVGLAVLGHSLLVLTKGVPYIITGTHPSSMSMEDLKIEQACVAKRSITQLADGVAYASPDGLVLIRQAGSGVVTEPYMTKAEWYALCDPTTLHSHEHDGRYYGFHSSGAFVFDPSDRSGALTPLNIVATASTTDLQDDSLYYVIGDGIYKMHAGAALSYTWKSKRFVLPRPMNYRVAQVIAHDYSSVTFKLYLAGSGSPALTKTVTSREPFKLPASVRYSEVEYELTGTSTVLAVRLANSIPELIAG